MNDKYLLSIITVTKNCGSTISQTLDSIELIKSNEIQYIVIDGESDDATLKKLRSRVGLIDCLISEADTGIYNAMNKGVSIAKGKYILFINGDDRLLVDGFADVLSLLRSGLHKIISSITLVGSVARPSEILIAHPSFLPLFNTVPHPSTFVSRDLLLRFPFREDLRIASDYDFFLQCYLAGYPFHVVSAKTAIHQRGGASGNNFLSHQEVDVVRRDRLGLYNYLFFNLVKVSLAILKSVLRFLKIGK